MPYKINKYTGKFDYYIDAEMLAHADLSDMPDTLGTNSDHDARYLKLDQTTPQTITGYPNFADGLTMPDGSDEYITLKPFTATALKGFNFSHPSGEVSIILENNKGTVGVFLLKAEQESLSGHLSQIPMAGYNFYNFEDSVEGRNREYRIYGYPTGGTKQYGQFKICSPFNSIK